MNDFEGGGAGPGGLTTEDKHRLVARILAGPQFAKAPQLKQFLLFVVERAITDESASINEMEIGRHVLRRSQSDFDPNTDNIVRVQARHLRKKLEEYFSAEGMDEPVLLTIPKGSYVPRFELRSAGVADALETVAEPKPSAWRPRIAMMTVAVLAAGLGAAASWIAQRAGSPAVASTAALAPDAGTDALWATMARTGRKTFIVLSDTSFSMLQVVLRRQFRLAQYLAPGYPGDAVSGFGDRRSQFLLGRFAQTRHTDLNSAIVASGLYSSGRRRGVDVTLCFPRDINIREFKSENFLIIGSRFSVPWMELVEGQLNFIFDGDQKDFQFFIRNKAPRPGEQAIYRPGLSADKQPTDYAAIALLPNLNGSGVIACLQGISGMANEAAQELISNPETSPLHKILRTLPRGGLPRVEILIRVTGMAGAPAGVQVVATRVGAQPGQAGVKGEPERR